MDLSAETEQTDRGGSRASTIIPYVNTRLLVIKQGQQSFVEGFKDEQL